MEQSKYANLDDEQLQELNKLEDKLGVTLVAYDTSMTFNSNSIENSSS